MLEFEPDFERRSSFGDAGWADHTVPDVQGRLRVHADILINGVRRHRQGQLTLAFKHGVATLDGGKHRSTRNSTQNSRSALGTVTNTNSKLLIYGLFQEGRVLAQDGVADGAVWSYPVSPT